MHGCRRFVGSDRSLLATLVAIFLYIRLVSRGPAWFKQPRLGEMGEYFVIYKFRTMHHCDTARVTENHRAYVAARSREGLAVGKPDHSDRLIPGGGVLRGLSLDELPQLFNVLIGNMSLIGPRPDVLEWSDYQPWQLRRFEVRPGISGLWQVSGKNRLTMDEMVALDIRYAENRSLKLDLWIIAKTFGVVFSKDNQ